MIAAPAMVTKDICFLMKSLALILLSIVFSSCSLIKNNEYDYGDLVLLNLDFENHSYSPWEGHYSIDGINFSYSDENPVEGDFCGKFLIKAGDDYWKSPNTGIETARSELQLKDTAPAEKEIYYSWYVRIDANYVESKDWQIIGQFHDQPYPASGETWDNYPAHSPPLSYKYRNGYLVIAVYSWDTNGVMDIASAPMTKGVWHKITSRVFWTTNNNGHIEVWLDDIPIENPSGLTRYIGRNCFNNAGNYINIGLYRSNSILSEGIVYYDDIKSGLTYESVE